MQIYIQECVHLHEWIFIWIKQLFFLFSEKGLKPFKYCGYDTKNGCSFDDDDNGDDDYAKICYCDTDLCNSPGVRFVANLNTLMTFGFLVLIQVL